MAHRGRHRCTYGLSSYNKDVQVPLKEIHTDVVIRGFIADVESSLIYYNNATAPIEAKFVFPMDDKSAVYKFEALIENRHIVAECKEKSQAQKTYREAISRGQTAMFMSEDHKTGDIFEILLGNLPPDTEAKLTLAYTVELPVEANGIVVFTLPTVLNPRYFPRIKTDKTAVSSQKSSSNEYFLENSVEYAMMFTAKILGDYVIKSITSSKDKLEIKTLDDNTCAVVKVDDLNPFRFDHDLTIEIKYADVYRPQILVERGFPKADGILKEDALMLNFYPNFEGASATKGEYVFIIDRSGSMGGSRMRNAKETLLLLIQSLPADSMFNIIGFGSSYCSLFKRSKEYNEKTFKKAKDHQASILADMGGTEILEPLKFVYSNDVLTSYCRQIFLLTDGEVANTREVIALASSNARTSRVFTFGIGEGASTALVENVAAVSGGKATFVRDNERLQSKVISAMKCAMQPSVTNIQLNWKVPKGLKVIDLPKSPPVIFRGEKLILYALIQGKKSKIVSNKASLRLTGKMGGMDINCVLDFDTKQKQNYLSAPIHRLAAKAQIKELENEEVLGGRVRSINKELIVLLSVSANVVSKYTAFVGVDKNANRAKLDLFKLLSTVRRDVDFHSERKSDSDRSDSDDWEPSDSSDDESASTRYRPPPLATANVYFHSSPPSKAFIKHIGYAPPSPPYALRCCAPIPPPSNIGYQPPPPPPPPAPLRASSNIGYQAPPPPPPPPGHQAPPPPPPPGYQTSPPAPKGPAIPPVGLSSSGPRPPPPPPAAVRVGPPPPPPQRDNISQKPSRRTAPDQHIPLQSTSKSSGPPPPPPPPPPSARQGGHPPPPPPPPSARRGLGSDGMMIALINIQEFDGSWKLTYEFARLFWKSVDDMKEASPIKNYDVWTTAIAITWLRSNNEDRKDEWELIELKAMTWLSNQALDGKNLEEIMEAATVYISSTI